MIGLYDYDIRASSSRLLLPNLEIMKLYNYYKVEENKFTRFIDPLDTTEDYDLIYFFSEQYQSPEIPSVIKKNKNVIYGGTALTNGEYQPFKNELIDYTLPSTGIYKNFLSEQYHNGLQTKVLQKFLDSTYYRAYAGENRLPIVPVHRNKPLYLYDTNFFFTDWQDIMDEIIGRGPSAIYTIHPIKCTTFTEYFEIRKRTKISRTNQIILDINIPREEIPYMLNKYKHLLLADISISAPIFIQIGGNRLSRFAYYSDLIEKLNLLYAFWAAGIAIKVYYQEPKLGYINPIASLSPIIAQWSHTSCKTRSIDDKIILKTKKNYPPLLEKKELLHYYPWAADLFEQTSGDLMKRRYWKL